jgi:hypothetical protein
MTRDGGPVGHGNGNGNVGMLEVTEIKREIGI